MPHIGRTCVKDAYTAGGPGSRLDFVDRRRPTRIAKEPCLRGSQEAFLQKYLQRPPVVGELQARLGEPLQGFEVHAFDHLAHH
jgi:hypothetical protein